MFDFIKSFGLYSVLVGGLTAFVAGCGVSQYNSLVDQGVTTLRAGAKFKHLYAPTTLPDSQVSVRLPMVLGSSYRQNSAHKDDGAAINPDRLQPPFLKLPGFKLCYEGTNTQGNQTLPFYCYLADTPATPGEADKLAEQLLAQLKKAFPETTAEWQTVDADTPRGKYIHWRKIRVEGDQPFFVKTGDKVAAESLPGVFELWLHDADNHIVLIGWRTPDSIKGAPPDSNASEIATLAAMIDGPPKDAKLDLDDLPTATAGTLTISESDGN